MKQLTHLGFYNFICGLVKGRKGGQGLKNSRKQDVQFTVALPNFPVHGNKRSHNVNNVRPTIEFLYTYIQKE